MIPESSTDTLSDCPASAKEQARDGIESPSLWQGAFSRLPLEDQRVLMPDSTTHAIGQDPKVSSTMEDVLKGVINTVRAQHEIRSLKNDNCLQEGARKILNAALAAQGSISALVACDPTGHASSAWTVISLGLKITQNYRDRQNAWFQSSEFLSETLARFTLIEARYYKSGHAETKENMRDALLEIYVGILRYSVEVMKAHGSGTGKRIRDTITDMTNVPLDTLRSSVESKSHVLNEWIEIEKDLNYSDRSDTILAGIDEILAGLRDMQTDQYIKDLPTAANASFDSFSKEPEEGCLEGTRVDLLRTIENWVDDPHEKPLFWLSGLAGTGKSTISRTMAKLMDERGILGGSFFFKRGENDRASTAKLIPTLLSQLVRVLPQLKGILRDVAVHARAAITLQFDKLLSKPLSNCKTTSGQSLLLVVVIDALDECEDVKNIQVLLMLFSKLRDSGSSVELRFFLTSRPEVPIDLGFSDVADHHQRALLHEIDESVVKEDIATFFNHKLQNIRKNRKLKSDWPGLESTNTLIEMAVPLFIFAATICRVFEDFGLTPTKSLKGILEHRDEESKLAKVYVPVLSQVLSGENNKKDAEVVEEIREVIGAIVILEDTLAVVPLSKLIQQDEETVRTRVECLPSVLRVPADTNQPVRLFHKSFRDFLLDPETRDKNRFWVDETEMNEKLAFNCIQVMDREKDGLRKNLCGLKSYGVLREEIDDEVVQTHFPAELQYACRHWVRHLEQGKVALTSQSTVHQFLQRHFLHWVEAMSMLRYLPQVVGNINTLQSLLKDENETEITNFLYDAKRFVLENIQIAEQAPLQLYSSALVFAPHNSIVRNTFEKDRIGCISQLPTVDADWGTVLQTIEDPDGIAAVAMSPDDRLIATGSDRGGVKLWSRASGSLQLQQALQHSSDPQENSVYDVAISPNGQLLASYSNGTPKIWNLSTGLAILQGEFGQEGGSAYLKANVLAFSPDSKTLAFALENDIVQLWDVESRVLQRTFEGTSPIAFSPDNNYLVTISDEKNILLHNLTPRMARHTLTGHSDSVMSVSFSPDGRFLVSGSYDYTLRVWDVELGTAQQIFTGHSGAGPSVAYSRDGHRIASAGFDLTVRLWDVQSGALIRSLEGFDSPIRRLAFSSDSRLLVSSDYATIKIVDISSPLPQPECEFGKVFGRYVLISPNQNVVAALSNTHISFLDTATGKVRTVIADGGIGTRAGSITFSPNSKMLSLGCEDHSIRLWDVDSGDVLGSFRGHQEGIYCIAISPDSTLMASASFDRSVRLWDIKSGDCLRTIGNVHDDTPDSMALSHSNELLAVSYNRGVLRIWETTSGKLKTTIKNNRDGHNNHAICGVAFWHDDRFAVTKCVSHVILFWEVSSGALVHSIDDDDSWGPLVFSDNWVYLMTDYRAYHIDLDDQTGAISSTPVEGQIEFKNNWVRWGGRNILWLPTKYRPPYSSGIAVMNNFVAVGGPSGQVSMIRFNTPPDEDLHCSLD
ncbi:WD40 repeat-like protein [Aspergillus sclerotiicarbonarius CBS 121057]|uniref:WD40 repeat-like protein n=1 Tax=Aspergillus sclerotiicarbonarius (strain CBS 121057 / IBT 28362) TaxID=1448318 RepID=A0A319E271_ASPSB|nr:WD40 repeat-like protein [Aspergillus sclerotiicarbonarius CBS 121057]